MPPTTKTIRLIWQSRANPHTPIPGHHLKCDIKNRVSDGIAIEVRDFNARDEKDGEDQPPEIVRELPADLLPDELRACGGGGGA